MKSTTILSAVLLACAAAGAQPVVLYDATLGTRLDEQGWLYQVLAVPPIDTTNTYGGGATVLDSSADLSEFAGFGIQPPGSPVLDRTAGFTLEFTLRIEAENHGTDPDRAGFSIIVVTSDLKAIELGFWEDTVWAQDDVPVLFVHDEEVAFDTTAAMTQYDLHVLGEDYTLSIVGDPATLSGKIRDYTAWVPPPGFPDPYEMPGLIFLGDDTTSAGAEAHITRVAYLPEPATMVVLGLGTLALFRRRRRRVPR